MIYDKIENIHLYRGLSPELDAGLRYLEGLAADIAVGQHTVTPHSYANVQEYTTLLQNPNGYETHRRYIDIQYLQEGQELVKVAPLETMRHSAPYNEEGDYQFHPDHGQHSLDCPLGGGYFVVLFPHDAHMPQLALTSAMPVKKVVVKVAVQ